LQEAKRLGFESVYLVTSDVQKAAMKLYEKLGFKKLGEIRINDGITAFIPESFHGVRRIEYMYQIPK
jgi:RimJ/RimL family protein N-acetyltransferase